MTGTQEQVDKACRLYRVYAHKAHTARPGLIAQQVDEEDEGYLVDHSIAIYLLSPSNEFLEYYPKRIEACSIVEKIENHIKEWGTRHNIDNSSGSNNNTVPR